MRLPVESQNTRVRTTRDRRAFKRLALLLFCALVLAGGFVFAAQQHFAAVKYGYDSESLRKEREELLRERQRLLLQKETASSPGRLETAARSLGLQPLKASQVGIAGLEARNISAKSEAHTKASETSRR